MIKNLLARLMPLDKLMALALRLGVLSKPLELLAKGWNKAQGARTQGLLAVAGALGVAASIGWLPWETARPIIDACLVAAIPTALDKANSVLNALEKGSAAVKAEAEKVAPPAPPAQ